MLLFSSKCFASWVCCFHSFTCFSSITTSRILCTVRWEVNVFFIPPKGNRGMQKAYLIYSLSHPKGRQEWLGVYSLPRSLSDPYSFVWSLFYFLRKRNLTNGPPMTRRIADRFSYLSSLFNVPSRSIDILTDQWLSRHQWWSEDMLSVLVKILGMPCGTWKAMMGLGKLWWVFDGGLRKAVWIWGSWKCWRAMMHLPLHWAWLQKWVADVFINMFSKGKYERREKENGLSQHWFIC